MLGIENIFSISLQHYIFLGLLVFFIGFLTLALRKNLVVILIGLELMLNGVNIILISISQFMAEPNGQVFSFFILSLAAAEAGLGLALVIALFKNGGQGSIENFNKLKG